MIRQLIARLRHWLLDPGRENFYLLTSRLIDAALDAQTFDQLDEVKRELHERLREYATHEDFADAHRAITSAITTRTLELHGENF